MADLTSGLFELELVLRADPSAELPVNLIRYSELAEVRLIWGIRSVSDASLKPRLGTPGDEPLQFRLVPHLLHRRFLRRVHR